MSDDTERGIPPEPRFYKLHGSGNPLLATAIAALVMIGLLVIAPATQVYDAPERIGFVLGGAIFGLIVWGICWAITVRKASAAWKAGSLAVLIAVGVVMALAKIGSQHETVLADAHQTVTQIKGAMAAGPSAKIEAGADAGPMTRLTAVVGNMILADTNDFAAASSQAGLAQVISLEGLTPGSPVLDHCDRIDALGPRSRAIAARYPAYIDAARNEGARLVRDEQLPQAELDGMIHGMSGQQQAFNRQWTLGGDLATGAGQLCRILALRHWQNTGSAVRFADEGDLAEANAVRSRLEPVVSEVKAIGTAARAQSAEAIQKLEAH